MIVLTLINEKGGVGKTTSATHIAAGLGIRGKRVVLIDADPQGHATISLGVKKRPALYNLIVNEANWDECLTTPLPKFWAGDFETRTLPDLWLLPGNVQTQGIPVVCDPTLALMERIKTLEGWADIVVIDTPPTPSALQTMIYLATTHVIYPAKCESLAIDGLAETVGRLYRLNTTRKMMSLAPVNLVGVLPTMYDKRTTAHQHGLKLIEEHFNREGVLPPLTERTVWRDREYRNETLYAYKPDDVATEEMWSVLDVIEQRCGVSYASA